MLAMTHPVTSSKVVLVENRRPESGSERAAPLRRYRLARVQLGGRSSDPRSRFDHLKRTYD
jgi:hypothetical protein